METTFFLKSGTNDKLGIIHFKFTQGAIIIKISTGIKILKSNWSLGKLKKNPRTIETKNLMDNYQTNINRFIQDSILYKNRNPSRSELSDYCRNLIRGYQSNESDRKISELVEVFLNENVSAQTIKPSTLKYKKFHLSHYVNFVGYNKRISELDYKLIDQYKNLILNDLNENSTKNSYRKSVLSFLNWLNKKEITDQRFGSRFEKFPEVQKQVIALMEEEIIILENAHKNDLLSPSEMKQIDIFLFGCYTALSIKDIGMVKREMIVNGVLEIKREKTDKLLSIPLIPEAKDLLEKYEWQLPMIHLNKGSAVLKKAFEKLELNRAVRITTKIGGNNSTDIFKPLYEVVSWHKARKTAITFALGKGIDSAIVMLMSGHSDSKSFGKYIDATEILAQQMKKLSRKN
jgi:integrase